MKVIEMGNLGLADGMVGLLIEASKTELQKMANLLYEDVKVASVNEKKSKEELQLERYFNRQVDRYQQVALKLANDTSKTYGNKDVLKILDFVLDGIGILPKGWAKSEASNATGETPVAPEGKAHENHA